MQEIPRKGAQTTLVLAAAEDLGAVSTNVKPPVAMTPAPTNDTIETTVHVCAVDSFDWQSGG